MVTLDPPMVLLSIDGAEADVAEAVFSLVPVTSVAVFSAITSWMNPLPEPAVRQCSSEKVAPVATGLHVTAVVPEAEALWAAKALKSSAQSSERPRTVLCPFISMTLLG
jgi:hypothetical protein